MLSSAAADGQCLEGLLLSVKRRLVAVMTCVAVFQAERDSERFALYARKAALDERAEEIRQQLKVGRLFVAGILAVAGNRQFCCTHAPACAVMMSVKS